MNYRGFTLLEMMIAIAIVAITASILFRSNTGMLRQQGNLEQHTIAHWILVDQIAQFRIYHAVDATQPLTDDVVRVIQAGREYEVRISVARKSVYLFDSSELELVEFEVYERTRSESIGPLDSISVYFVDQSKINYPALRKEASGGNTRRRGSSFSI